MLALRTALLLGFIAFAVLLLQKMPLEIAIYRSVIVTLGVLFLMIPAALVLRVIRGKRPEDEERKNEQNKAQEQEESGSEAQIKPGSKQDAVDSDNAEEEDNKNEEAAV